MSIINPDMPRLFQPPTGNVAFLQKGPLAEAAAQNWFARTLVQVTGTGGSEKLQRCAAAATAIFGLAPQAARGSATLNPPDALFRDKHYPFDVRDIILAMTISNGSLSGANIGATGVTYAGGGTGGVALAPGQQYGLITLTSGTYDKFQFVDVTNTTQKVFEIVGLAPGMLTTDNNARVLVKVLTAALQG